MLPWHTNSTIGLFIWVCIILMHTPQDNELRQSPSDRSRLVVWKTQTLLSEVKLKFGRLSPTLNYIFRIILSACDWTHDGSFTVLPSGQHRTWDLILHKTFWTDTKWMKELWTFSAIFACSLKCLSLFISGTCCIWKRGTITIIYNFKFLSGCAGLMN